MLQRTHLINRKGVTFAQDRRPLERLSDIFETASKQSAEIRLSPRLPTKLRRLTVLKKKPYQLLLHELPEDAVDRLNQVASEAQALIRHIQAATATTDQGNV